MTITNQVRKIIEKFEYGKLFTYKDIYFNSNKLATLSKIMSRLVLQKESVSEFLLSDDFFSIIDEVKKDDTNNHEFRGEWLSLPLMSSSLFSNTETVWKQLESTYTKEFAPLVYGDLPNSDDIVSKIKTIALRLKEYDDRNNQ